MNLTEKFMSKVVVVGGHWIWKGGKVPQFWTGEKVVLAARWIFEQTRGPIRVQIRNTCGYARCVNPEHYQTGEDVFWGRLDHQDDGCWLWTGPVTDNGYGFSGRRSERLAHRYAWSLTKGPIPKGLFTLHRCDVRLCCNPDHLFLGTASDNMRDMYAKGRANPPRGTRQGHSKLTDDKVRSAHARVAAGETISAVAKELGVSNVALGYALNGKTWKHLGLTPLNIGSAKGARQHLAKLTENCVHEMRARREDGETFQSIANRYGVSIGTAHGAISGNRWKHVQ